MQLCGSWIGGMYYIGVPELSLPRQTVCRAYWNMIWDPSGCSAAEPPFPIDAAPASPKSPAYFAHNPETGSILAESPWPPEFCTETMVHVFLPLVRLGCDTAHACVHHMQLPSQA